MTNPLTFNKPKTTTNCPVWYFGGPHSWATDVPGVYTNVCNHCGTTRAETKRKGFKPKVIAGGLRRKNREKGLDVFEQASKELPGDMGVENASHLRLVDQTGDES